VARRDRAVQRGHHGRRGACGMAVRLAALVVGNPAARRAARCRTSCWRRAELVWLSYRRCRGRGVATGRARLRSRATGFGSPEVRDVWRGRLLVRCRRCFVARFRCRYGRRWAGPTVMGGHLIGSMSGRCALRSAHRSIHSGDPFRSNRSPFPPRSWRRRP
jgi:hypothetical protein